MVVFRKVGQGIGQFGGTVVGGAVKLTGKAVGSKWQETGKWIEEVGDSVKSASEIALDNAGQFIDGTVQTSYGAIKKDDYYKQKGINDLKESTTRTVKGIGGTVKYAASNSGSVYTGLKNGDREQAIGGLKNIGKVVAVSSLAIGVLDVMDGVDIVEADELETRNDHLLGSEHPDTGVPFVEKSVVLPDGQIVEGIFPVFESPVGVQLEESYYTAGNDVHFRLANEELYQTIMENPGLEYELGLSSYDVAMLSQGENPVNFTWHHNEEPGLLQLVDEETHAQTAHTGGRAIWGGGEQ